MTEHNASDIPVRPVRMTKSRAEKAKFIEIAPGKHIEASVSMRKLEKRIVRLCAMACTDYGMIKDGDKIAVAMSGGKDSYVLLDALLKLKARAPVHFDIIAVHVNQHIPGSPTHLLEAWLKEKGVAYHIENQDAKAHPVGQKRLFAVRPPAPRHPLSRRKRTRLHQDCAGPSDGRRCLHVAS